MELNPNFRSLKFKLWVRGKKENESKAALIKTNVKSRL